jgi:AcrR family transcriptional regulator
MPNIRNNASTQETRRRLMAAAGEVFAQRGLHAATIKEITDRAGVNMAAINYHFSDKYELYAALIRQIVEEESPRITPTTPFSGSAPEQLRQFIRHLMTAIFANRPQPWKRIVLSRELVQPTASFDCLHQGFIAPMLAFLEPQVRSLLGEHASKDDIDLAVGSILGQCFYYVQYREMIARTYPNLTRLAATNPQQIADHIADVMLSALCHRKRSNRPLCTKAKKAHAHAIG